MAYDGFSIRNRNKCNNIKVRSDLLPSKNGDQYTPEYLSWVTLHALGHAIGLGHPTNLLKSIDIMGYGWSDLGQPVLSDCDINALAFVFAWALNGETPIRPRKDRTPALFLELRKSYIAQSSTNDGSSRDRLSRNP